MAGVVEPAWRPMPRWLWMWVVRSGAWRWTQSAPPPGEAGQAAGGTRRQLRGVVGGTLLAAADRLPLVLRGVGEGWAGKERPNSSSAPALHRPHPHCASPSRLQSTRTRIAASSHRTFTRGDCFQDRQPKARDERSGQGRRQALALALTASEAALTLPLLEQSPTPSGTKNNP